MSFCCSVRSSAGDSGLSSRAIEPSIGRTVQNSHLVSAGTAGSSLVLVVEVAGLGALHVRVVARDLRILVVVSERSKYDLPGILCVRNRRAERQQPGNPHMGVTSLSCLPFRRQVMAHSRGLGGELNYNSIASRIPVLVLPAERCRSRAIGFHAAGGHQAGARAPTARRPDLSPEMAPSSSSSHL